MAVAVDVIDRHGPSNEMRCQLQPKKTKVVLYYSFVYQQKIFYPPFLTRRSALVLKVSVLHGWKLAKCVASYS